MPIEAVLSAIDDQITKLQHVRSLLSGQSVKRGPGRPPKTVAASAPASPASTPAKRTRTMSAEGRARIAAAQRARWSKLKKAKG